MANGFASLYIGQSGLQSAQYALNTTANNLANTNTTGYVREQVRHEDKDYLRLKETRIRINGQQSGLGVSIADVAHVRDIFLDESYRMEKGRQAFYDTCYENTQQLIEQFQELDGQEFKETLANFYTALEEFMKDPVDSTNQSLMIQRADLFSWRCQSLYSDLQNYQSNINDQIKDDVARINEIGEAIYEINLHVQRIESANVETAMELRDQRDNLLDELAGYGRIEVTEDTTGFVFVDFEGQRFVDDYRANVIDMKVDKGTGFVTPYWRNLSDPDKEDYTEVFRLDVDIDPDYHNDLGTTKARLINRGPGYGRYADLEEENYPRVEDCVVMETEAELDKLYHTMVTQINDLLYPNTDAKDSAGNAIQIQAISADGTLAFDASGAAVMVTVPDTYNGVPVNKVYDSMNASYGSDGKLPPPELFARMGTERYSAIEVGQDAAGNPLYVYMYNEEDQENSNSLYTIGNVQVNPLLIKDYTKIPSYIDNPTQAEDPEVDMATARKIVDLWLDKSITFDPKDSYPCVYTGFYDKLMSKLSTEGNIYMSKSETLTDSMTAADNKRMQVMGVSSDEELTKMIKFQAAYNAASRYITVISQMTELLVSSLK